VHRIRLSLVAFLAAFLAVGLAGPAHADPAPSEADLIRAAQPGKVQVMQGSTSRTGIDAGITCYIEAHFNHLAVYSGGSLATVTANYFSSISCVTPPGVVMAKLHSQSSFWLNSVKVDTGHYAPVMTNSNFASSYGDWWCAGPLNCSGTVWSGNVATMQMPAGWVWNTPVPPNCYLVTAAIIVCSAVSSTAYISPVG
jgi:hypothetical protein